MVKILREADSAPVVELAEKYDLHGSQIVQWKAQL